MNVKFINFGLIWWIDEMLKWYFRWFSINRLILFIVPVVSLSFFFLIPRFRAKHNIPKNFGGGGGGDGVHNHRIRVCVLSLYIIIRKIVICLTCNPCAHIWTIWSKTKIFNNNKKKKEKELRFDQFQIKWLQFEI